MKIAIYGKSLSQDFVPYMEKLLQLIAEKDVKISI